MRRVFGLRGCGLMLKTDRVKKSKGGFIIDFIEKINLSHFKCCGF